MRLVGKFGYIFGFLLSIVPLFEAQQPSFRNLVAEDGLTDLLVSCTYKDTEGFIWIGTNLSVERYDGVKMKHYYFTTDGATDNKVNTIIETPDKQLWVGNANGLWKVNPRDNILQRMFPEKIDFLVQTLACDSAKNLYIGTSNGFFILSDGVLTQHLIEKTTISTNNQIIGIRTTDKGIVWLLTPGGIASFNVTTGVIRFYAHDAGFTCMTGIGNKLYIGTAKNGLWAFDTQSYTFSKFLDVGNNSLSCISSDDRDMLYIGTFGSGVNFVSVSQRAITRSLTYDPLAKEGISSDMISSLLVDNAGNIWVGTKYYTGLGYMQCFNKPFQVYSYEDFNTYNLIIRSIFIGKDFKLIGTREGFYYVSEKDNIVKCFRQGTSEGAIMRSNLIFSLFEYEGRYLIGTCKGGLYVLDPISLELSEFDTFGTFGNNDIMAFHEDKHGNLWIAASDGIYCYDKATKCTKAYTFANAGLLDGYVYYMFVDSKERMWVATQTGLCIFDRDKERFYTHDFPEGFIHKETVRNIVEDKNGNLFFCLLDGRLFLSNGNLSKFRFCNTNENDEIVYTVYFICQEQSGNIWMATDQGVIRSDDQLANYVGYSVIEGMPDINCTAGANIVSDHIGRLWFCTAKGVISIDPSVRLSPVPLKITDVYANGLSVFSDWQQTFENKTELVLDRNQNNLKFSFVALTYDNPKLVNYEYQLENYEQNWNRVNGQNEALYYGLPVGKYVFHVRKLLDNTSLQSISINIKPLIWPYVICGGVIALVIMILILIKYGRKTYRLVELSNDEQENATENLAKNNDKYKNTKLDDKKVKIIIDRLNECMEKEKPYINPSLKLHHLATAINCSPSTLSQVFNIHMKERYYDYINRYRVEEFKRIAKTDYAKFTMTSLAERCGFGSQATFFRFFRHFTGTTPHEYLQKLYSKDKTTLK
jgi:ligand-binding sensor domain-containing protein/AraC-like DNA-binding protein